MEQWDKLRENTISVGRGRVVGIPMYSILHLLCPHAKPPDTG